MPLYKRQAQSLRQRDDSQNAWDVEAQRMRGLQKGISTKSRKPKILFTNLQRFGSPKKKPLKARPQQTSQMLDLFKAIQASDEQVESKVL